MQILINIPDEEFERLVYMDIFKLREYIQNGVVLPKGHGRLKDTDKFNYNSDNYITKHGVESAPTVIEADQAYQNEDNNLPLCEEVIHGDFSGVLDKLFAKTYEELLKKGASE